ncbi:peptidoglycan DD-metalloendopeptidase family protein [Aquabacterium sp.]|uniref:peptidoglycan DD-metalloendopeptidase family protein n=1 Tax=Aquabacterium sp. TaxID=1872578 RepID=UPI0035B12B0A
MNMQLVSRPSYSALVCRTTVWGSTLALLMLAGCATRTHQAPVEDRGGASSSEASSSAAAKPLPGTENAGKPGYYTVKQGDTLIRISLESGQNWRDLVKWNNLDNPNLIEVGQVLRVAPPGVEAPSAVAAKPVATAKVDARPLESKPLPPASATSTPAPAAVASSGTSAASGAAAKDGDDDIAWAWPAGGSVVGAFDDVRHKGISVGGKAGDPVVAAADGRVVYAGSGLRGYGNLIIIKHNATYLSAYAHNQVLLVKEDQAVRRGQKIAEMGSTEADRVELHFEIRRQGRPIDPMKLLPAK